MARIPPLALRTNGSFTGLSHYSTTPARGTVDSTYYAHYTLHSGGKLEPKSQVAQPQRHEQQCPTISNVYFFVANATGYTSLDVSLADLPLTNITGTISGPLNVQYYVPIPAPNTSAIGAGGGAVFVASGLDTSFTVTSTPAPANLTAQERRGRGPVLRCGVVV
ncbi:hypothetical protein EDB92DRAFT_1944037 [Lactarius akahatsu]|uniref:Uncharacterized protein n=1 Tax=Lactarius akahatsu TaxID=416441 RepID=A0AAD4QEW9_9AGAM|nr:hypothetical protein EDB92DRAFT_1944037 [Lactarius akahatsu]